MASQSETEVQVPPGIIEARLNAHWASQAVAAASSLLPAEGDFSQMSMVWVPDHMALVGRSIDSARGVRVGLRVHDLHLIVLDEDRLEDALPLEGKTLKDALHWLSARLREKGALKNPQAPDHDLPAHPVGAGASFARDASGLAALSEWFAAANGLLLPFHDAEEGASEIRCWPHHFDIATLISLGEGRSVGLGMCPGDGNYPAPYWYASPWPYPGDLSALPDLGEVGHWHIEGFVGAILPSQPSVQGAEITAQFMVKALAGCRALVIG
jgi:hypothetical protein